jgi:uncharacterized protein (DUF4415 family)
MARDGEKRRYQAKTLEHMRRRGESRTDWAKVRATPEAQIEASAAADPDEPHEADWTQAIVGIPARKQDIRIDADVLSWFKGTGKGYQTRINKVLRAFVESRQHTTG